MGSEFSRMWCARIYAADPLERLKAQGKSFHVKFLPERKQVNDAWERIADTMGVPVHELKKKKESLMTYFRENFKKKILSLKSGAAEEDAYKPVWMYYDAMEEFLKDVYECKSVLNSEEDSDVGHSEVITWSIAPMKNDEIPPTSPKPSKPKKFRPTRPKITREPTSIRQPSAKRSLCDEVLQRVQKKLDDDDEDEFDVIGRNVAIKLRKLSRETKVLTEKLLMEVLFEAELGNIDRKTKLTFE